MTLFVSTNFSEEEWLNTPAVLTVRKGHNENYDTLNGEITKKGRQYFFSSGDFSPRLDSIRINGGCLEGKATDSTLYFYRIEKKDN